MLAAACLLPAPLSYAEVVLSASICGEAPEEDERRPWLGVMVDAGVPDGLNLALVIRPEHWLRLHAGPSHNLAGFGLRGGLSVLPIDAWITPSVVVEVGHFFDSDLRAFVANILREDDTGLPERITYTYGNAHLGVELGTRNFTFFLRAGYSLVEASTTPSVESQVEGIRFDEDARLTILTPSAKLGLIVYLL